MAKARKIRVLLADDHAILRSGLRMLINTQPDMEVAGEAGDGEEAVRKARELRPDVSIIDITMPKAGGLKAAAEIGHHPGGSRVLVLTMHPEPAYLRTALSAGVLGYVLKKSVDADLLSAIRAVHQGKTYVDSEMASYVVQRAFGAPSPPSPKEPPIPLSARELEVLRRVAEGYSSREIAAQIFVSTKTVETYRARIAEKLGLKTRAEMVQFALESELLSTEKLSLPRNPRNKISRPRAKAFGKTK
jgi:two-component system response regulator NreC